jgi:hypothetical protein
VHQRCSGSAADGVQDLYRGSIVAELHIGFDQRPASLPGFGVTLDRKLKQRKRCLGESSFDDQANPQPLQVDLI